VLKREEWYLKRSKFALGNFWTVPCAVIQQIWPPHIHHLAYTVPCISASCVILLYFIRRRLLPSSACLCSKIYVCCCCWLYACRCDMFCARGGKPPYACHPHLMKVGGVGLASEEKSFQRQKG
jgi:hypothetical protein